MEHTGRRSLRLRIATGLASMALVTLATAQTAPTPQTLPYAEDFSSVAYTATAYPAGWQGWTISTSPAAAYNTAGPTADRSLVASSGASTTSGNVHNYDGKIGFLNSGSLDLTLCLALSTTGSANVQVAYDIMTIRNPYDGNTNTRINEVSLQYRVGASGSWTTIAGQEYQSNTTLQTGAGVTTPQNSQPKTVTLPNACDNQAVVQVRWASRQVSGGGSRPSFALDNVTVTGSSLGNTAVSFALASSSVSEGVGTTNLVVNISDFSTTQSTTVDVVLTAGSAARVNNYTTQTVTFPLNDGTPQLVPITVTDDGVYDGGGTVTFTLQNISGGQGTAAIGAPASHALTITENEPSPLLINEVDYDNPTPPEDNMEFVELVNTGLISIDLAGYKVELVNGSGGAVYTSITLPSFSLAPGGYYVIGNNAAIPNINLVTGAPTNFIQNGSPDAVGLRDPSNLLLDAVSYEGSTLAPYTEGTGIASLNSDDGTAGIGISRYPDGTDTNDNSVDWSRRCLSPGESNNSTTGNCICTPVEATAVSQCVDDFSWEILVSVTSTGSGTTVDITNDVNGASALGVGVGDHLIGPFNNNEAVNILVSHETFDLCDLALNGFFMNCQPDCNNVIGGPDVPGAPCDDGDEETVNDVWSPACVCAGAPVQPIVGFISPTSNVAEDGLALTIGLEMDVAPASPVVVDVTDLLTGTATSGADYAAIGTLQFTFLPTDTYPYLQTFNVLINDDADYESIETFSLSLSINSGPAATSISTFVGVIISDDLPTLRINEVDYDNAGTDNAEWLELKNTGAAAFDIGGFSVQLVNGGGGGAVVYKTIVLPSYVLAAGDYYVIGNNASIPNLDLLQTPATDLIQNGSPDAIGLRDPLNTLIDAISYEGNTGAPYTEGTGMSVTEFDDNVLAAKVIARYLDGNDTDDNSVDWKVWCATPGASNSTVDADGDVIPDCLDNCPNLAGVQGNACDDGDACTIGDVITGACVCAGTFQDSDSDGICDASDNCPNLAGVQADPCDDGDACTTGDVITAGCVCAGTFQDSDGDGVCDASDICPGSDDTVDTDGDLIPDGCDPCNNLTDGQACDDGDACTTGDVLTACVCAGTFQDSDGDGVCDASDICPGSDDTVDTDGDLIPDGCDPCNNLTDGQACDDGDACTTGDVLTACVCAGIFQDTDSDGICDASDNCPNLAGVQGDPCDDNDAGTENDLIDSNCLCSGTPIGGCTGNQAELRIQLNGDGGDGITWEIRDDFQMLVSQGGPYVGQAFALIIEPLCLPNLLGDCYSFLLFDSFGDGIAGGSWELRDGNGATVLRDNGAFTTQTPSSASVIGATGHAFCLPLGPAQPTASGCGVFTSSRTDKVFADVVGGALFYQFEFSDPNAGFIRRIAVPRSWVKYAEMQSVPLVAGTVYFCRVRVDQGAAGFADDAFGAGCEMGMDPGADNPCTSLIDDDDLPTNSCGATKTFGGSDKIWTRPVSGATQYRFRFVNSMAGFTRIIQRPSYVCLLSWVTQPLVNGTTYDVSVESYVGGTWSGFCGNVCPLTIAGSMAAQARELEEAAPSTTRLSVWPNPNSEGRVRISLSGLGDGVHRVGIQVYDLLGASVQSLSLELDGAELNHVLPLESSIQRGVYLLVVQVDDRAYTERLVIQ